MYAYLVFNWCITVISHTWIAHCYSYLVVTMYHKSQMHVGSKFISCQNRVKWAIFAFARNPHWLYSYGEYSVVKACVKGTCSSNLSDIMNVESRHVILIVGFFLKCFQEIVVLVYVQDEIEWWVLQENTATL